MGISRGSASVTSVQPHEAHFLVDDYIALEPLALELLDIIGNPGPEKHRSSMLKKLSDIKVKVQTFQVNVAVKNDRVETDGNHTADVEEFIKPLIEAAEYLIAPKSDFECSKNFTSGLIGMNHIIVDDRSWFHVASALDKLNTVKAFIRRLGCNCLNEIKDFYFRTPLLLAAAAGHHSIVRLLLENGADPVINDDRNQTPLQAAAEGGHRVVAKYLNFALNPVLHRKYVSFEFLTRDLLDLIGTLGTESSVLTKDQQNLLDKIFFDNLDVAIEEAAGELFDIGFVLVSVRPLIQAVKGLAPLKVGEVRENADNLTNNLCDRRSEFTRDARSWFHVACAHGNTAAVKALILKYGCDPQLTITDAKEWTPLFVAANEGHIKIVALLIRYCAVLDEEMKSTSCPGILHHKTIMSILNALETKRVKIDETSGYKERLLSSGTVIETSHEGGIHTECVVVKYLDNGAFGHVYQVFNIRKLCFQAVKVVRFIRFDKNTKSYVELSIEERVSRFRSATIEVERMLALGEKGLHPNLVAVRGLYFLRSVPAHQGHQGDIYDDNLYILMDYVPDGMTLKAYVVKFKPPLETIIKLMLDVARGLLFITEEGYTHRDIKPDNILVDVSKNLAKISDFGCGYTFAFASPETARGEVDPTRHQWTWATTTLAALNGGECSWTSAEEAIQFLNEQIYEIDENELRCAVLLWCKSCMQPEPELRCSMEEIVVHLETALGVESSSVKFDEVDQTESWQIHTELGRIQMTELTQKEKDYECAHEHFKIARDLAEKSASVALSALSLNNLGRLLRAQGKYDQAKRLYKEALEINVNENGILHPAVANTYNNVANLLMDQGEYHLAMPVYKYAIGVGNQQLSPDHPNFATWYSNLAESLRQLGQYDEAKSLNTSALKIRKQTLGCEHPDVAKSYNNFVKLLMDKKKYLEAERYGFDAVAILKKKYGSKHPAVATALNILASIFHAKREYEKAKPLFERVLKIRKFALGPNHPSVATALNNLAGLINAQNNFPDADPLFERSLKVHEMVNGSDHPDTITTRAWIGDNLIKQGKYPEALPLLRKVLASYEQAQGEEHLDVARSCHQLARLLQAQGKNDEARTHYERAIGISQKHYRNDHPLLKSLQSDLRNLVQDEDQTSESLVAENSPGIVLKRHEAVTDAEAKKLYDIAFYGNDKHKGDIRRLRTLLEQINDKSKLVPMTYSLTGHKDIEIPSPLFFTCALGKREMTMKLLHSNFSLNLADANGHTPFHYAAAYGHIDVLKQLWEFHRKAFEWTAFRAKDNNGRDAVDIREGVYEGTVKLILSDLFAKDGDGGTIVDKLEFDQKEDETLRFLIDECKFREVEPQRNNPFEPCDEDDTPSRQCPRPPPE